MVRKRTLFDFVKHPPSWTKNFRIYTANSVPASTAISSTSTCNTSTNTTAIGPHRSHLRRQLLNQPSTGNDIPPTISQGQSSLSAHVPTKVKQAILKGEYVEFDSLLPENLCLSKKTNIDSIDKWLLAFAVYCTVLLTSFPQRAVEMFCYQEIIRSAQRKFAGFAWLSYDIDLHQKAPTNLAVNWGERDPQLFLMKFTGQATVNPPVQSVGVGITPLTAAPSLPLDPLHEESASASTGESSAAKTHAPSFTAVRPVMESTPPTAMKTPLQIVSCSPQRPKLL